MAQSDRENRNVSELGLTMVRPEDMRTLKQFRNLENSNWYGYLL